MKTDPIIEKWLKSHKYCVLSTSVDDKPWSATVDYTCDEDLNILISTSPRSLKYTNALKNSTVCLVIDNQDRTGTLQIQGQAKLINGKPFEEPNLLVKPTFMIFKKKNEKTGELIVIKNDYGN